MTSSSGHEVVSETVRVPVSGGVSVTADVGGPVDGPTVVLLHGGGQTRHSWHGTWRVLVEDGWQNRRPAPCWCGRPARAWQRCRIAQPLR